MPSGFTMRRLCIRIGQPPIHGVPALGRDAVRRGFGRHMCTPCTRRQDADIYADGLQLPSSLAFSGGDYLYVGETSEVVRLSCAQQRDDARRAKRSNHPEPPTSGYHWTRTVAIGPDDKLYVAVGSDCESCVEDDIAGARSACTIVDGSNGRLYATGLRNPVGIAWQPGTNQMWITNNENDETGDDYLNSISDGGFYGWPYCYGPTPNSHYGDAARCANVPSYAAALGPHSTPLGLTFGDTFAAPRCIPAEHLHCGTRRIRGRHWLPYCAHSGGERQGGQAGRLYHWLACGRATSLGTPRRHHCWPRWRDVHHR